MRQQIRPGLRRAWRAPGRLQIGLDARQGLILDGLGTGDEIVLAALERGVEQRVLAVVARAAGVPDGRVRAMVARLREAGLLVPARTTQARLNRVPEQVQRRLSGDADVLSLVHPDGDGWHVLAQRRDRSVAVVGARRLGASVAMLLAAAAVGTVLVEDDARVRDSDLSVSGLTETDLNRRRGRAVSDLVRRTSPHTRTSTTRNLRPDLVVLVGHGAMDPHRYDGLLREDVAHLAVLLRERDVVVGPLVLPGTSACLRCLDLHRRDRDPEWPRLVPQLAVPGGTAEQAEETTLAACGAALAVAQALAHLDGRSQPASVNATLEVGLPDGLVDVRPWSVHHACGCQWSPARANANPTATLEA